MISIPSGPSADKKAKSATIIRKKILITSTRPRKLCGFFVFKQEKVDIVR